MKAINEKKQRQSRRRKRVRKKVFGDAQKPRLTVYRSLRHMYAQIIDDETGFTLAASSTSSKDYGDDAKASGNKAAAQKVGKLLARKALALGIHQVRFDRNGYQYHGRIRSLAEGAREGGLVF